MKIRDLPKTSRPREKLLQKGSANLQDYELLAIVLRTGYRGKSALDVAQRILRKTALDKLVHLPVEEIAAMKGVGKSRAASLKAAFELIKRSSTTSHKFTVNNAQDVCKIASFIAKKKKEYLLGIYLNARQEVVRMETISIGILNEGLIHPREVFAPAIRYHAAYVVVTHNHPSGQVTPSEEDRQITKRLDYGGKLLGVTLLDHVIVCADNYFSFAENQLLSDSSAESSATD